MYNLIRESSVFVLQMVSTGGTDDHEYNISIV